MFTIDFSLCCDRFISVENAYLIIDESISLINSKIVQFSRCQCTSCALAEKFLVSTVLPPVNFLVAGSTMSRVSKITEAYLFVDEWKNDIAALSSRLLVSQARLDVFKNLKIQFGLNWSKSSYSLSYTLSSLRHSLATVLSFLNYVCIIWYISYSTAVLKW